MIVDELISILGYDIKGEDKARRFAAGMDGMAVKAKRMATALVAAGTLAAGAFAAVGAGMFKMAKDAAGPLDELVKFSDRVNVNIESLQEWQFAAEQSGASSGEFQGSIETLSKNLGEVARGTGRAKKAFDDYGLSAKDANGKIKSADVVMGELADKFQKLTDQQALDLGGKLGMTPGMITMLKSGRVEIEKLQEQARKNGLVFSEKDARNAERFNDALNLFDRSMKAIRHRIGVEFLPVLSDVMDGMQGWMQANQDLIRQNITVWTGRVLAFMRRLISLAGQAGAAVDQLGGYMADFLRYVSGGKIDLDNWQGFLTLLGLLLAAFRPVWAFAALAALAIDDFLTYMRGGESVLGDFIQAMADFLGADPEAVASALKSIGIAAASLAGAAIGVSKFAGAVGALSAALGIMGGTRAAAGVGNLRAIGALAGMFGMATAIANAPTNMEESKERGSRINTWLEKNFGDYIPKNWLGGPEKGGRVGGSFDENRFGGGAPSGSTSGAMENYFENMRRMGASGAAASAINDNRNQSIGDINITQNIQQAAQAPAAAASATGAAVKGAAVGGRKAWHETGEKY